MYLRYSRACELYQSHGQASALVSGEIGALFSFLVPRDALTALHDREEEALEGRARPALLLPGTSAQISGRLHRTPRLALSEHTTETRKSLCAHKQAAPGQVSGSGSSWRLLYCP